VCNDNACYAFFRIAVITLESDNSPVPYPDTSSYGFFSLVSGSQGIVRSNYRVVIRDKLISISNNVFSFSQMHVQGGDQPL
jgi:hypothetical protein